MFLILLSVEVFLSNVDSIEGVINSVFVYLVDVDVGLSVAVEVVNKVVVGDVNFNVDVVGSIFLISTLFSSLTFKNKILN